MLTKTLSAQPPPLKRYSRSNPWVWVVINQLAFPGLGTVMAGGRNGYGQAATMLAGFFLMMNFFCRYFVAIARYLAHSGWTDDYFHAQYRPYLWTLVMGLGLCFVAWCWALLSSIAILRNPEECRRRREESLISSLLPK